MAVGVRHHQGCDVQVSEVQADTTMTGLPSTRTLVQSGVTYPTRVVRGTATTQQRIAAHPPLIDAPWDGITACEGRRWSSVTVTLFHNELTSVPPGSGEKSK